MKRYNFTKLAPLLLFAALLLGGCSARLYEQPMTYDADDMYGTHSAEEILRKRESRLASAALLREQRMAQWADILGYDTATSQTQYLNTAMYDTPYGERLLALSADSYERPSSYYSLSYNEQTLSTLAQYDPSEYNAVVDELGNVSVEPKYLNSMYGSWAATPYATTWGYYPHYGWYDWRYGITYGYRPTYDPWWGYSPYYSPYYSYSWYRPPYYYRPYVGGSYRPRTVVKRANPYVAPSSGMSGMSGGVVSGSGSRRSDGSTVGRSTGSSYNRGGTTSSGSSSSTITRSPSVSTPAAPSSGTKTNAIGR